MIREIKIVPLQNIENGEDAGYMLSVGCKHFHVSSEAEARKHMIAIANDPQGHEQAFYDRINRIRDQTPNNGPIQNDPTPRLEDISR